ncbi:potassium-transporting ATPase subunit KdpC [Gryllotalpicola reticulitermitis]|uniref:Potassium-transporting ATPase KdpC subunit n=1 Tax=Gryllotalpicola reticulitermitis TaxID=1184153 RepID=A0ABV8Q8T4_9MICO
MPTTTRATVRQYWVAIRAMIVLTAGLGIVYPLVITGIGQLAFHSQANGSKVTDAGTTVGSSLIGQSFTDKKGDPLTQWFQTRPSAATTNSPNGYDANASSGSNYGPNNPTLVNEIKARQKTIETTYGVTASQIPADAVTASGSGLDPDISIAYAKLQEAKVAETRGISEASVAKLVKANTHGRDLGYLGQPYVNAVQLNLDLAKMDPAGNNSGK